MSDGNAEMERRHARMATLLGATTQSLGTTEDRSMTTHVTDAAYVETPALDRGLATGRLIEEAERLIRTIETSHKKAVRELPVGPLLAAVARMKELG